MREDGRKPGQVFSGQERIEVAWAYPLRHIGLDLFRRVNIAFRVSLSISRYSLHDDLFAFADEAGELVADAAQCLIELLFSRALVLILSLMWSLVKISVNIFRILIRRALSKYFRVIFYG